jgi:hypothetical protein
VRHDLLAEEVAHHRAEGFMLGLVERGLHRDPQET